MRVITLDGRDMDSRDKLHRVLKEALALPEHYGRNLDALNDCLGELTDIEIRLRHPRAMLNSLGHYGQQLLELLQAAAEDRRDFRFRLLT